jgi:hypothetical protein
MDSAEGRIIVTIRTLKNSTVRFRLADKGISNEDITKTTCTYYNDAKGSTTLAAVFYWNNEPAALRESDGVLVVFPVYWRLIEMIEKSNLGTRIK